MTSTSQNTRLLSETNSILKDTETPASSVETMKSSPSFGHGFFGLHAAPHDAFTSSPLLPHPKLFLLYRFAMATYSVVTLFITFGGFKHAIPPIRPWPVWLTNWSYLLNTTYFVLSFVHLFHTQFVSEKKTQTRARKAKKTEERREKEANGKEKSSRSERRSSKTEKDLSEGLEPTTGLQRLVWVAFSASCSLSGLVTIVFFVALFPQKKLDFLPLGDLLTHLFNSLSMLLDLLVCRIPFRLSHLAFPEAVCLIYVVFSVLYWLPDPPNNYLYKGILDWNQPIKTLIASLFISLLLLPLIHFAFYIFFVVKTAAINKLLQITKSKS